MLLYQMMKEKKTHDERKRVREWITKLTSEVMRD